MSKWKLTQWSTHAASLIRYPPDRKAVQQELRDHLEDRFEDFTHQGLSEPDAVDKTLEAMGDAWEIAPMLAAIHRPFWGYAYRICKAVFLFLLSLVFTMSVRLLVNHISILTTERPDTYYRLTEVITDRSSAVKTKHLYPDASVTLDGFTFTLTEATQWHTMYTDTDGTQQDLDQFYFQLTVTSPYTFHRPGSYAVYKPGDVGFYFWAVDNLGNVYESMLSHDDQLPSAHLRGGVYITGLNQETYYMWLTDFTSQDAQWIELRYDRSGRDIRLRIDLNGGAGS